MPPVEEELSSDSTEAKPVAREASEAQKTSVNTYRLEPRNKFQHHLVKAKAQAILTNKLQHSQYDGVSAPSLCASLSEEILNAVKAFEFDRYKYVVSTLIVQKAEQAMIVASRWVWDAERDSWISAECETKTFIALALVMACYYE
ncbi:tctex1 domain-containing protein 3 [Calypte anna]|nr:tctex1 domain-containing protein 3 [Calypte anna]